MSAIRRRNELLAICVEPEQRGRVPCAGGGRRRAACTESTPNLWCLQRAPIIAWPKSPRAKCRLGRTWARSNKKSQSPLKVPNAEPL